MREQRIKMVGRVVSAKGNGRPTAFYSGLMKLQRSDLSYRLIGRDAQDGDAVSRPAWHGGLLAPGHPVDAGYFAEHRAVHPILMSQVKHNGCNNPSPRDRREVGPGPPSKDFSSLSINSTPTPSRARHDLFTVPSFGR
jgi:hypothetical protein